MYDLDVKNQLKKYKQPAYFWAKNNVLTQCVMFF